MVSKSRPTPPAHAALTRVRHTVAFYETDAMGVVHHSNYVRFLEHARVQFLADHDRPYTEYVAAGMHVPVTRVSVQYRRPCRFADVVEIACWLAWARQASLGFAYELRVGDELVAYGESDHAIVDLEGRPMRLPASMQEKVAGWLSRAAPLDPP